MSALLGEEKLPSVVKDPFSKNRIQRIWINFYPNGIISSDKTPHCNGTVEFANGDTKGEQVFKGQTFDEVVLKMRAMINNME